MPPVVPVLGAAVFKFLPVTPGDPGLTVTEDPAACACDGICCSVKVVSPTVPAAVTLPLILFVKDGNAVVKDIPPAPETPPEPNPPPVPLTTLSALSL